MNKVQRAIILAAGKGTRLQPVTLTTPKPLIDVNGKKIIDTVIEGLMKNGINEIYIVVGYLKEKFEELKSRYPNVKLIENPYYDKYNNISSLYVAKEHLENAIIMDADQIIYNPDILNPYFDKSGYSCLWQSNNTDEWLLTVDDDNIVIKCSRTGGKNGWQLHSVSRWNASDAKKLKKHLEYEFENGNNQIYWDDIAIFCHPNDFKLTIYQIKENDMIEIDNLDELIEIDSKYIKYKEKRNLK